MVFELRTAFFISWILLYSTRLIVSKNIIKESDHLIDGNIAALSDDEVSYALSELSVDDLNSLSKLIDVFSEGSEIFDDKGFKSQEMSEQLTRFKRQTSDTNVKHKEINPLPNVDEGYIRQLSDSFPNVIDQPNQGEKDRNHIRVKRGITKQ